MSVYRFPIASRPDAADDAPVSRMDRIRAEAQAVAREHTADFEQAIAATIAIAEEIADGGEAYAVGAREIARRVSTDLRHAALTLETLRQRHAH
ncbi:MAG: hypothetical protein ACHP84_06210 [Caulobacterales bacterium]